MKNNHLDFILEPIDKNRLAYLIGPEDENLVQIQKRLGVTIAYSGSHFHIEGEHKACKDAEYIIKNQRPFFIEVDTYRLCGHSKSDKLVYRDRSEEEAWKKKDPIDHYSNYLIDGGIIDESEYVHMKEDAEKAMNQINAGLTEIKETPDKTVVFMTPEDWKQMKLDRANCVGCLSQCQFSTWSQAKGTTGRLPDPRSYCIHKTLYEVGHGGSVKDHLLFAGHQVYRFATDPLYRDGIPSVKELIEKIKNGE